MIFAILEQSLIALPLILGAYLTLSLLKLPDFAIESAYLMGAVAAYLGREAPFPALLLFALAGGALVGIVVTMLNQYFRIPFLLAAIVTNGLFHGFSQYLLSTSVVSFHLPLPFNDWIFFSGVSAAVCLLFFLIIHSQLGYSFAIYGNNPLFFVSNNFAGRYVVCCGVILGHGLAALSGFLFAHSNGFIDVTMNIGVLLLCLTALMIGKLFFTDFRPHLIIPLIGIIAYFAMQQSLLRLGLNLKYFNSFQALVIFAILLSKRKKDHFQLDHLGV